MTIQIKAIYNAKYLNIMSEILKYIQVVVLKFQMAARNANLDSR